MATHLKLLAGKKFSGRHTTIIPTAIPLLTAIKEYEEVTKITLAIILPYGGKQRLHFKPTQSGWELKVIGGSGAQIFFIHTKYPEIVRRKIEEVWGRLNL